MEQLIFKNISNLYPELKEKSVQELALIYKGSYDKFFKESVVAELYLRFKNMYFAATFKYATLSADSIDWVYCSVLIRSLSKYKIDGKTLFQTYFKNNFENDLKTECTKNKSFKRKANTLTINNSDESQKIYENIPDIKDEFNIYEEKNFLISIRNKFNNLRPEYHYLNLFINEKDLVKKETKLIIQKKFKTKINWNKVFFNIKQEIEEARAEIC